MRFLPFQVAAIFVILVLLVIASSASAECAWVL